MSKQVTESLVFRPASELPTAELNGRAVLVFNPCDGWHDGFVRAREEDGEVYHVGIYPWMGSEMLPHDFYITGLCYLTKASWLSNSSQRDAVDM